MVGTGMGLLRTRNEEWHLDGAPQTLPITTLEKGASRSSFFQSHVGPAILTDEGSSQVHDLLLNVTSAARPVSTTTFAFLATS